MASLAVTNTLSNGATILASEHNTNYSDIVTYINNRNSGSATWDAISVASSSNVPVVLNNSTGTQDIFRAQDNGTNVMVIADGGYVTLGSQSSIRAYRNTSTQALSNTTKIQFNAESYDVKSEFDSATNYRFTATVAGKYLVAASISITSPANAPTIYIYVNGSQYAFRSAHEASSGTVSIDHIVSLAATDYIEIYVDAGASGTVNNGADTTFLTVHKIA
jgi:hypothetical protein